jgi:hypothetical protein
MPSSVATANLSGISMEVDDEGWSFHLVIKVPKLATNVEKLYQLIEHHWEDTKLNCIPCLEGFHIHDALEDHLANLCKKETESLICQAVFPPSKSTFQKKFMRFRFWVTKDTILVFFTWT